jgi:D-3-phosphoglycerate dehydrogenase
MRILVACELSDSAIGELRRLGSELIYQPAMTTAELVDQLEGVGILIVGPIAVTPEAVQRATSLQMIVVAGTGGRQVAVDEASAQGIIVCHCPGKDTIACAELALGMLIALDRQIVSNANTLSEGRWERNGFIESIGLAGHRLGILGPYRFYQALAARARAMRMEVCGWISDDENEQVDELASELQSWPRDVARQSQMIVIHLPDDLTPEPILTAEFLERVQPGTCIVHIGELSVQGEQALAEAIKEKSLRVAVDVPPSEPTSITCRVKTALLALPGTIGTHHLNGATAQARNAIGEEVVRIISNFLINGEIVNSLNICERSPATWQLVMRLRDQVGVMASVLDAIRADGINAEDILSRVFVGAKAAWCTISLDERPSTEALSAIRVLDDVLHLELRAVV